MKYQVHMVIKMIFQLTPLKQKRWQEFHPNPAKELRKTWQHLVGIR